MKFFLVGIKGSGMAALAHILKDDGHDVFGSDVEKRLGTDELLIKHNIHIFSFSDKIIYEMDFVIIGHNFMNTELASKLKEKKIPFEEYHKFISLYLSHKNLISICGSHGKTTLVNILSTADPFSSFLRGDGFGKRSNQESFFFLESCEYKNHFLVYKPEEIIITNIDYDHVDFFKTEKEYQKSFSNFTKKGNKIYCLYEDKKKLNTDKKIITYGLNKSATYRFDHVSFHDDECYVDFYKRKKFIQSFVFHHRENHILENFLVTLAFYHEHNYDLNKIAKNIDNFVPANQRFNVIGTDKDIIVVDYAHHPSQMKFNYEQCQMKFASYKKIAFFKPDRKSRMEFFMIQMKDVLSMYDMAFVLPLPENKENEGASSKILCLGKILYLENYNDLIRYFDENDQYCFSIMSSKNIQDLVDFLKKWRERYL